MTILFLESMEYKGFKRIFLKITVTAVGAICLTMTGFLPAHAQSSAAKQAEFKKQTQVPIPVDAFDLKTCYELALLRSETIGMSEADIRVAEARFWQAVSEALPKVKVTGNQYFFGNPAGGQEVIPFGGTGSPGFTSSGNESRDARVNVRVPIFSGLSDFYAGRARDAERKASRLTKAREIQKLYLDTAEAFYQVITYTDDLKLLHHIADTLQKRVQDLEKRVRLGKSRGSELLAAQTDLAEARVAIERTKGLLAASRELLSFFIGIPSAQITLRDGSPNPQAKDIEEYLRTAGERPDILASVQNERAARDAVTAQRGQHLPQIRAEGDYFFYSEPGGQREWTAFITVDIPIFEGGMIEAKVNERKAIYTKSRLDQARLKRETDRDVRTRYQNFNSSVAELLRLQEAERTAIQNYQAQQADYELGVVTNLDVLQSFRQLVETQRRLVEANVNTKLNLIRLHVAAGDLPR